MNWIDAKDKQPEKSGFYLVKLYVFVSFDKFEVCMGFYDKQNERWILNYSSVPIAAQEWIWRKNSDKLREN